MPVPLYLLRILLRLYSAGWLAELTVHRQWWANINHQQTDDQEKQTLREKLVHLTISFTNSTCTARKWMWPSTEDTHNFDYNTDKMWTILYLQLWTEYNISIWHWFSVCYIKILQKNVNVLYLTVQTQRYYTTLIFQFRSASIITLFLHHSINH